MAEFNSIKIKVTTLQDETEIKTEVQPISGEALNELLKINSNPLDAVLAAIKMAIFLRNRYGSSFEVLNKQKGGRATDIFEWDSIQ